MHVKLQAEVCTTVTCTHTYPCSAVGDRDRIRLHTVEFESPESSGKPLRRLAAVQHLSIAHEALPYARGCACATRAAAHSPA